MSSDLTFGGGRSKKPEVSDAPPTAVELDRAAESAISRTEEIERETGQTIKPKPGILTKLIKREKEEDTDSIGLMEYPDTGDAPIDYAADEASNDPLTVPSTIGSKARSVAEFLVGPEMGILGFKWEEDHYSWSLQNSAEQWVEEPLWSSLAAINLALATVPPIAASLKFGRMGAALGRGFKYTEPLQLGTAAERFDPLLAKASDSFRWFEKFSPGSTEEIKAFEHLGYIEPGAKLSSGTLRKLRAKLHNVNRRQVTTHKVMASAKYDSELRATAERMAAESGLDEITPQLLEQATTEVTSRGIRPASFDALETLKIKFDKYFANRYFEKVNDVSPDGMTSRILNENLAKHTKDIRFSKFADGIDAESLNSKEFGKKIWQEVISRAAVKRGTTVRMGRRTPMNPAEQKFFSGLYDSMADLQSRMIDDHFLHPDTMHDPIHIAALRKRGVAIPTLSGIGSQSSFAHMMGSPSLLPRKSNLQELHDIAEQGGLHADTFSNIVSGHMADDMLFFNMQTVRDLLVAATDDSGKMASRMGFVRKTHEGQDVNLLRDFSIISHKDLMDTWKHEHRVPKNYVSLDEMFHQLNQTGSEIGMYGAAALRRMLLHPAKGKEALITTEEGGRQKLPWVSKQLADLIFGKSGLFEQGEAVTAGLMEVLTTIYKINKTAFNPASHTQNILGNAALLSQAGFNPFNPENLTLLKDSTSAFKHIHDAHMTVRALFNSPNIPKEVVRAEVEKELTKLGKSIKYRGKEFDVQELMNPIVQQLYEEGSFEAAEGLTALSKQAIASRSGAGRGLAKIFTAPHLPKGYDDRAGIFYNPKKGGLFHRAGVTDVMNGMNRWYLGEDVIPKLALYFKNRSEGMTIAAAAEEVARRLPMYGTVGKVIREGRRIVFPWATFPSEALRITKNNLMDNPLAVLPWLRAPQVVQSMFAMVGIGEDSPEAVSEAKRNLPLWAQTPMTVVTEGGASGAGAAAGAVGGFLGSQVGAAVGGIPGAAVGAAAGVGLGAAAAFTNDILSRNKQQSEELRGAILNWIPHSSFMFQISSPDFKPNTFYEWASAKLPTEPLAIFKPFLEVWTNQTPFGDEIPSEGPLESLSTTVAGMIGFLSPPWVQKYGFKTTTPDVSFSDALLKANNPDIIHQLDPTNMSRLFADLGALKDPQTGNPGNPLLDFLIANTGVWKSYPATGVKYFGNQKQVEDSYTSARKKHAKNLQLYIRNGEKDLVLNTFRKIQMIYLDQYHDDPNMAYKKFREWRQEYTEDLLKSPLLMGMSKKELDEGIAEGFAGREVSIAQRNRYEAMMMERATRYWQDLKSKFGAE